jgi:hypothetical protein
MCRQPFVENTNVSDLGSFASFCDAMSEDFCRSCGDAVAAAAAIARRAAICGVCPAFALHSATFSVQPAFSRKALLRADFSARCALL